MNESKTKEHIDKNSLSELSNLIEQGFDIPLRITKTGIKLISDSLELFQGRSRGFSDKKKHRCDCDTDWCNADCWDYEFSSCCYTSHPATDLWMEGRIGERHIRKFVIENNRHMDVAVDITVHNLMDACGNVIEPKGLIIFSPGNRAVIPACSCLDVLVAVNFAAPLKHNSTYYAEIKFKGECAPDPITLGFRIEHEDIVDHLVLYDPCRPQKGRFVEFESCSPCSCGCSKTRKYYVCNSLDERNDYGNNEDSVDHSISETADRIKETSVSKNKK